MGGDRWAGVRASEARGEGRSRRAAVPLLAACLAAVGGCELEEITIVENANLVVAEVYVHLAEDPADNRVLALLHWTAGSDTVGLPPLSESRIVVSGTAGGPIELVTEDSRVCASTTTPEAVVACFVSQDDDALRLLPGARLEVDVELSPGGSLFGATQVPGDFGIVDDPGVCRLDPDTHLEVRWTRSAGAWAYVNETSIRNLPAALAEEGIEVEEDPLYLLGLSISDQDTTIVFPSEFGVFNRFDLDQALAVRLQTGIPASTLAEVTITAVDRGYVNWARGGNFNPSGQVRVPSLRGDGTGVFASTVNRRFVIVSEPPGQSTLPDCRR